LGGGGVSCEACPDAPAALARMAASSSAFRLTGAWKRRGERGGSAAWDRRRSSLGVRKPEPGPRGEGEGSSKPPRGLSGAGPVGPLLPAGPGYKRTSPGAH